VSQFRLFTVTSGALSFSGFTQCSVCRGQRSNSGTDWERNRGNTTRKTNRIQKENQKNTGHKIGGVAPWWSGEGMQL